MTQPTLAELEHRLRDIAELTLKNPVYAPIMNRLKDEVDKARAAGPQKTTQERAAENPRRPLKRHEGLGAIAALMAPTQPEVV